jgi:TolA-binding protein
MNADIHTIFSSGDCPPHEQLLAYFKGTLSGEEKNRIEHHLMECEMCSDELGGLSKMKDFEMLPGIVAEIRSGIKTEQGKIIRMNPRILLTAAAALVLLIIGVVFLFRYIPLRQREQVVNNETEKSVQLPPAPMPPSSTAVSNGKPLLAAVQPPKKKEVSRKEEEKPVPVVTEEMDKVTAMEEPRTITLHDEAKSAREQKPDSVIQTKALGYTSGVEVANNNAKMANIQPSPLAEQKKDMNGMAIRQAGPGADDPGMKLYRNADYLQAAILFEKDLEADSTNSAARYYLAGCRYHLKEYQKAKQLLQKIISNPKDVYYQRAVELMKKVEN